MCRWPRSASALLALGISLSCLAAPQLRSERMVAPGVKHISLYRPEGPWTINALEVDTTQNHVSLGTTLADEQIPGLETVSASASRSSREDRYVVAAVNGDYFVRNPFGFQGGPLGFQVMGGEVITSPTGRSALVVLRDGTMRICRPLLGASVARGDKSFPISTINNAPGPGEMALYTPRAGRAPQDREGLVCAAVRPANLRLALGAAEAVVGRTGAAPASGAMPGDQWLLCGDGPAAEFLRSLAEGDRATVLLSVSCGEAQCDISEAIGGGPLLARDGTASIEYQQEGFRPAFAVQRHPRTAVGIDGRRLVIAVVDGRQEPHSVGMTLNELAALMLDLGCKAALNLDGGGSSEIWVRGKVANSPSDGIERPVANSLLVFSNAARGPAARLVVEPSEVRTLAGQAVALAWHFEDENYNPASATEQPKWETGGVGRLDESGRFVAEAKRDLPARGAVVERPTRSSITASAGSMTASVTVTVYPVAPSLRIFPESAHLEVGESKKFVLVAADENGLPLYFDPSTVAWEAPAAGVFSANGVFTATQEGAGTVWARLGGQTATAALVVGSGQGKSIRSALVEDFESDKSWAFFAWPREVNGAFSRVWGGAEGKWAGRLEYDFTKATAACAAYARFDAALPAALGAASLSAQVRGDARGHWLRARLRDEKGERLVLDLVRRVDWKDEWRKVRAALPADRGRLVLESIYLAETEAARRDTGSVLLDSIAVETEVTNGH